MMDETNIGAQYTNALMSDELAYVQNIETNTLTLEVYLPSWMEQFRQNYLATNGFQKSVWQVIEKTKRSCIVVGAGPSLTEEQLELLKDYKGYIICSNKILERVLQYCTPDMVGIIHTTQDIAEHFTGKQAKRYLKKVDVMVSTCVHPDVTAALKTYGNTSKVHWFNAAIPDVFRKNMDWFLRTMTSTSRVEGGNVYVTPNLPTVDTGGNVGIFLCELAEMMGFKDVGILGMEQCLELDPKWTNEEAMNENVIYYAPEDFPEPFAMNQVFRGYLMTILKWYSDVKDRIDPPPMNVYNLTPKGFLYIGRREVGGMPYMDLNKYIEEFQ